MAKDVASGSSRVSKSTEAAILTKEEMIRAILDVLDRTWTPAESPGALQTMEEFFRRLDEPTLRAIGYQHGIFESELELEEREDRSSGSTAG
jgi:hypothetical protein